MDEHADNGVPAGRLLIIGGAEDRCCGTGVLERFVDLSGGDQARITLVTTATGVPDEVHAEYEQVFRKLGVEQTRELRLRGRADAESDAAAAALRDSTGVFFSGGDQSRILALVGSRANDVLREQLAAAGRRGHQACATAMGRTMILGGEGPDVSAATVRAGPAPGGARLLGDMHFAERGGYPATEAVALDPDHLGVGIERTPRSWSTATPSWCSAPGSPRSPTATVPVVHAAGDCDPITLFDVRLHLMPAGCVFDIAARVPGIGPAHTRY